MGLDCAQLQLLLEKNLIILTWDTGAFWLMWRIKNQIYKTNQTK